uniref:Glutathione S-transferase omega n=1 Tax=Neogobius melanostomus TaxID=47308 RepID=A0A8C6TWX8_9GOBI
MATEKCFAKGSAAPGPVPKGHIRLFSMRFCPFAQRTRLVLAAKGIKHDTINIHLKEKPDWFLEKNPFGLVPTLETEAGEVLYESPITCDYLDEVYPEKKLLPTSPFGKAQQRMMLEHFSKIPPYFYKITMAKKNNEDLTGLKAELKEKFVKLDEDLATKKTKFFGGDCISMIDYMMWPFFERLEAVGVLCLLDGTPELKKWFNHMQEDPAVKACSHSTETHQAFMKTAYIDGKPDYDYGL